MNAGRFSAGPNAASCQVFMIAPNRKPHAQPYATRAAGWRRMGASRPAIAPHRPHVSICHGVHGPWPRKALETRAAMAPTAAPARGPSATPVTIVMAVTGCAEGIATNSTRPAAAAAASVATSAISREPAPPRS